MDKDTIRAVFMKHGFTIREGQIDLKPYVYAAAEELIDLARRAEPSTNEDVLRFAIQVEKMLCAALGREWSAAGISIESLIAELAKRRAEPSVAADERETTESPADIVIDLRHYADNPGYSHNDYADTMRQAAHCIESMRAMFFNYAALALPAVSQKDGAAVEMCVRAPEAK